MVGLASSAVSTNGHLNGNGVHHSNGHTAGNGHASSNGTPANGHESVKAARYRVNEVPFDEKRKIKVVCIGSGFSGLYLALRLQQRCENVELVIYEKNADIGGTWLENVYPGAACDVPSVIYSYTFEPDTDWTQHYARGPEILSYLNRCADKFKARRFIRFNHKVTAAIWDEEAGKWKFQVDHNGQTVEDEADIFVNAGGFLNAWKWPTIAGMENYKGKLLHTASWDQSYDYKGKKVAVIGSGSSALQVVPNMVNDVEHMTCFIRSPTYIPMPMAYDFLEKEHGAEWVDICNSADSRYKGDMIYTPTDKERFKNDPDYFLKYRQYLEGGFNRFLESFLKGTEKNEELRQIAIENMKLRLHDRPDLLDFMIPKWEVGCRRLSPGLNFLESLKRDNVTVVHNEIARLTESGLETEDGKEWPVDAIVCATGFDMSFKPRFLMRGRGGFELNKQWAEEPRGYISIAIENMPNYFHFNGPNCSTGNGSVIPCIEAEGDYIIKCINKIQQEHIKSMTPQIEAIEEFSEHADAFMPRSTWSGSCSSWYKTKSGRCTGVWPGTSLQFIDLMKRPRWEDYDYEYITPAGSKKNRFTFLGNGFPKRMLEPSAPNEDFAPYLEHPEPAVLP